jgi:hypothetical protein
MEITDGQKSTRKALLKRVASDYYKRKRSTQDTKRLLKCQDFEGKEW